MEEIKMIVRGFLQGLSDSMTSTCKSLILCLPKSFQPPKMTGIKNTTTPEGEPSLRIMVLKCIGFNGGVLGATILIFRHVILHILLLLTNFLFVSSANSENAIWTVIHPVLSYTFEALWVLPLYILTKIMSVFWLQDIADTSLYLSQGRRISTSSSSIFVADLIFSVIIQTIFILQVTLFDFLPSPAIGQLMGLVSTSLLYSWYAFEYKWFAFGWKLDQRLSCVENNWPYFLGFGFLLALLTSIPQSFFLRGCVFSIAFPIFMIAGTITKDIPNPGNIRIPLFSPAVYLSNKLLKFVMLIVRRSL